jgi:hypothetical protein
LWGRNGEDTTTISSPVKAGGSRKRLAKGVPMKTPCECPLTAATSCMEVTQKQQIRTPSVYSQDQMPYRL